LLALVHFGLLEAMWPKTTFAAIASNAAIL
jgi:hypothetical protein